MIINKEELAEMLRSKYYNNPGFFDVINEFSIYDFYQLYSFKEQVIWFLKTYHINGVSVEKNGELAAVIYPFQHSNDVLLALYAIAQYLK